MRVNRMSGTRGVWLAAVLGLCGGCEGGDVEYRMQLSIIELQRDDGPEDLGVGLRIAAPDTVSVREVAEVSVRTYGDGCLRRSGEPYTFVEWRHDRHVILIPFDQVAYPGRSLNEPLNCAGGGAALDGSSAGRFRTGGCGDDHSSGRQHT